MMHTSQKAFHNANLIMLDSNYSAAFDSLSELECTSISLLHLKDFLTFISEKAETGENVEDYIFTAIGLLEFSIEKFDRQFPQVWKDVIVNHPSRNQTSTNNA